MVNVVAAQQAGGLVPVVHAELAPRPVAVGVDGGLGHAQLAGDLLGAEVLVDEAQALTLPLREQADRIFLDLRPCAHGLIVNDGLTLASTLSRKPRRVKRRREPAETAPHAT